MTSGTVSLAILSFAADSLLFQMANGSPAMTLQEPCVANVGGGTASLEVVDTVMQQVSDQGSVVLRVVFLSFSQWNAATASYVPISYDASAPPGSAPPPVTTDDAHPLLDVVMVATALQAAQASATGLTAAVQSC